MVNLNLILHNLNEDGKQLPDKLTTTEFLIVKELAKRPGMFKERFNL